MVLTLSGSHVCAMTRFDASTLPRFGLPAGPGTKPAEPAGQLFAALARERGVRDILCG
jgi:hypothetical protein